MIHSAKSMFTDWYNDGLKKDASKEELQPKRTAIEKLLEETEPVFWLDLLKIYFGKINEDGDQFQKLTKRFKAEDEFFPLKNKNLLKLLAGCTIAEKIEKNNDYVSDLLALGVIINFPKDQEVLTDLYSLAMNFWLHECESKRLLSSTNVPEKIAIGAAKKPPAAIADHTGIAVFSKEVAALLPALTKEVTSIILKVNSLIDWNGELQNNFDTLAEELNILWWVFGGYSNIINKPLNTLSEPLLSIIVALDLASLTEALPGVGKIDAIINKALNVAEEGNSHSHTIEEFIFSINAHAEIIKKHLPLPDASVISLCPLFYGLVSFIDYSGKEWKEIYTKKTGVETNLSFSLTQFTGHLYKELMFLRVYNEVSKSTINE